jgi:hypothetical protein
VTYWICVAAPSSDRAVAVVVRVLPFGIDEQSDFSIGASRTLRCLGDSASQSKSYANPFDLTIIELQATFQGHQAEQVKSFSFYDGGTAAEPVTFESYGFMPDELGNWHYG